VSEATEFRKKFWQEAATVEEFRAKPTILQEVWAYTGRDANAEWWDNSCTYLILSYPTMPII